MPEITLRQSELADEPIPIVTIRKVLKSAGFDMNAEIERHDDFFNDKVTFRQDGGGTHGKTYCAIEEPCTT